MRTGINGRLQKLEKRLPPTLKELFAVIDQVVKGTTVWNAAMAIQKGEGTAEHQAALNAFWDDENWYGAKRALDAIWPREVWELVYLDHLYQALDYKDCLDGIGCDIWEMETDIRGYAIRSKDEDKPEAEQEQARMAVYGHFCRLPEDERKQWRQAAKEDFTAFCRTDNHSQQVQVLIEKLAREMKQLKAQA